MKVWMRAYWLRGAIAIGVAFVVGVYCFMFFVPKTVHFSYGNTSSCITWPTLFPAVYRNAHQDTFTVTTQGGFKVGGVRVFSTQTCVSAVSEPHIGTEKLLFAPFGLPIYTQPLNIVVPRSPHVKPFSLAPVPITKPLIVSLSNADVLHTYILRANDKEAPCSAIKNEATLTCNLPSLKLKQGQRYKLQLARLYKTQSLATVATAEIQTLTATKITSSSLENGATVYDKPTKFTFTTDKKLSAAKITLRADDQQTNKIEVDVTVDGATATATIANALEREKVYTMIVDSVEAVDGSTLVDPYKVTFIVSGGPKVTGVSIGQSGVATNARITVTFDQKISDKQDIAKLATIKGGAAQVQVSGNRITYSLQGMGLCTPLTLTIAKGLLSNYDIASNSSWTYPSRTICYATSVYGYSVRGRALVAYRFGSSGPTTMYVGAIHGNEPSSSGLMRAWINYLDARPSLYSGRRIVVIPTINPDGLIAGTRMNARSVNLNRNFPTDGWQKDIDDTDGYHASGGGDAPLSEPESKALANFTLSIRPRLLLSFHAVGSLVTGDLGGYSAGYAAKYASMVGYRNATGQSGTFDYSITGAYEDWTYAKHGIPSMVVELGSYGYYSFAYHQAALRAMLD